MMNKNNTRRALFLSAVSMFLCIVMLAGSTYAWFTDTVEVKTSRIEAGVLDVELEYTNDAVGGIAKFLGTLPADATVVFTNNTLTNCAGHDGADSKWFALGGANATITVSGNTLDGAAWTPGAAQGLGA